MNTEEPRLLGLAMVPGRHVKSLHVDIDADFHSALKSVLQPVSNDWGKKKEDFFFDPLSVSIPLTWMVKNIWYNEVIELTFFWDDNAMKSVYLCLVIWIKFGCLNKGKVCKWNNRFQIVFVISSDKKQGMILKDKDQIEFKYQEYFWLI